VILISTLLAVLLLLDALSSVKCKTIGKAKSNRSSKVASGADYESDEDERPRR
jgi:F0F1-type ATP synthase membrane subunit b/b'